MENINLRKTWKVYWEDYYKENCMPKEPSLFAEWCWDNYLEKGNSVVELGCGNGRDAVFFASNNIEVQAIDQYKEELNLLSKNIFFPI